MNKAILEAAFEKSRAAFKSELSKLRSNLESSITSIHSELQAQINLTNSNVEALRTAEMLQAKAVDTLINAKYDLEASITATHSELQDQIKHANGEIAALKDEFEEFKKITTREPYASVEKIMETVQPSLPTIKTYTEQLETENVKLRAELDELGDMFALAVERKEKKSKHALRSAVSAEVENLNAKNAELQTKLDEYKKQALKDSAELVRNAGTIEALQEELNDVKSACEQELNICHRRRIIAEEKTEELRRELINSLLTSTELNVQLTKKNLEFDNCKADLHNANGRIKSLEAENAQLRDMIANSEEVCKALTTDLESSRAPIKPLESALEDSRAENVTLRARLDASESLVQDLREAINVFEVTLADSKAENAQLRDIEAQITNCKADYHTKEEELRRINKICDVGEEQVKNLQFRKRELEDENADLRGTIKALEAALETSRAANAELRREIEQLHNRLDVYEEKVEELTGNLFSANETIKALEAALETSRAANADLRRELEQRCTNETVNEAPFTVGDSVLYESLGLIFTVGAIRQGTSFEGSDIECHYLVNGELQRTWLAPTLLKKITNASVGINILSTMKIDDKNSGTLTALYDGAVVNISFSNSVNGDLGNRSLWLTISKDKP